MNDSRHPVQPAPAAPTLPRIPGMPSQPPQQQTIPRPAAAPAVHSPHAPQARPAIAPAQQAPQQPRPMQSPQPHAPHAPLTAPPPPLPQARPAPAAHPPATDEEAIALEDAGDEDEADLLSAPAPGTPSKIKFGAELGIKKHAWKRQLKQGTTGACRVRTFHGKLSDQGLEYIDEAINVWLDDHPEIDIKFVTTNVGMFDGKFKDLALVVNVWY